MEFLIVDTTEAQPYYASQKVVKVDNCNGFIAINTGDTIVRVNGTILYPGIPGTTNGDSKTYGCNFAEIFSGHINVSFDTPAGTAPQVTIEQKYYVLPTVITSSNKRI